MDPRAPTVTDRTETEGVSTTQLEQVVERLEVTERRIVQLSNTVQAIATEFGGVSVHAPCSRCDRSLLLSRDGVLYCPQCHYRQVL